MGEIDVRIDRRFCGPPDSGNGGYVCGLTANGIEGPAEVTLRVPPPLERPLRLAAVEGEATLLDGETVVAQARSAHVPEEVPPAIGVDEAERAAARYPWRERHPYPTCFVCGLERRPGDGLRIAPGPVDDGTRFAAPWTPGADLADDDGAVRPEFVWAALDCPSGLVTHLFGDAGTVLLGRLTVERTGGARAEQPHVIQAWTLERDGRKLHTASALFTADGDLVGRARAVWIEVPPA